MHAHLLRAIALDGLNLRRALALASLLLAVPASQGCSERTLYEALRQREVTQCNAMPESSRGACLERTRDSYDDYQRKHGEPAGGQE